jgi:hypothetical protein
MRKGLAGCGLLLIGSAAFATAPYRIEQVSEQVHGNLTGCQIRASNSSGWKLGRSDLGIPGQRFEDPLLANIAIYDCPDAEDGTPASMIVIAPDGHREEACEDPRPPSDNGCSIRLRTPPAAGGMPQRYRLLIQLRPKEPVQPVDIDVRRQDSWSSATFDALMSG